MTVQTHALSRATTLTWLASMARPKSKTINLPPHVHRVVAGGRAYYYLQQNRGLPEQGPRTRLLDDPRDPAWWDDYRRHVGLPAPAVNPHAISTVMTLWRGKVDDNGVVVQKPSPEWAALAASTKVNWNLYCDRIEAAWGALEVQGVQPKHVLKLRDAYEDRPAAANNLLRCLSSFMSWCIPRGYRNDNPCLHVKKFPGGEWEPWPWEMIELLRLHGPIRQWKAAALALYSGQRQGDVLAMPPKDFARGEIAVVQEKTGKKLWIPLHERLQAEFLDIDPKQPTVLLNSRGQPWTKDGFKTSWGKALAAPETEEGKPPAPWLLRPIVDAGLVFHGLRKSAVVMLLEAGCTDAEVESVTGQSRKMIEHYAKMVNRRKLAASAILKWQQNPSSL